MGKSGREKETPIATLEITDGEVLAVIEGLREAEVHSDIVNAFARNFVWVRELYHAFPAKGKALLYLTWVRPVLAFWKLPGGGWAFGEKTGFETFATLEEVVEHAAAWFKSQDNTSLLRKIREQRL